MKWLCPIFLTVLLTGCQSNASIGRLVPQDGSCVPQVYVAECVHYVDDLASGKVPLDPSCDYLTEETARQIAEQ